MGIVLAAEYEVAFIGKGRPSSAVISYTFLCIKLSADSCNCISMDNAPFGSPEQTVCSLCAVSVIEDVLHDFVIEL